MNRSIVCRLGAAALAALVLGACGVRPDRSGGVAGKSDARYCRKLPANAITGTEVDAWPLLQMAESDLLSARDADFEIVKDFKVPPTPLTIEKGDRMILAMEAGVRTLAHYDRSGRLKARVDRLKMDEHKFWASGNVVNAHGNPAGTYYVYRTVDRSPCRHSEPLNVVRCREFHFEYFAVGDVPHERPAFGVNIPATVNGVCSGGRETGEGDGDEGRRRPQ